MANLDTPAKRLSSLDFEEVWEVAAPRPDGTIGQGDRQHSIWSYAGILFGAVIADVPGRVTPSNSLIGAITASNALRGTITAGDTDNP